MRKILYSILLLLLAVNARDYIRMGNAAYRQKEYDKAETNYLKSIEKAPSFEAYYNLGNAYVMQQKDSTAFENYKKADSISTNDPMRRARNFHNMGNIWYAQGLAAMNQQDGSATGAFLNAVNYYKSSLRCNPDDNETRYNLAMAQYQLKKNQDNNNGGGGNNDQNQDKQDEEQQKQDQQKQDEQQQNEQNQNQQQQPDKDEMSDQTAEQLLNSAQQDEKGVQHKVNQNSNNGRRTLDKDW